MNNTFLELVVNYGVWMIFATTLLSCLALPVPASLVMLAGGAFVASEDLTLYQAVLAALSGAVIGDQIGYGMARQLGKPLVTKFASSPKRAALFDRAQAFADQRGGPGVFFSRWLVSPLGPYVNFVTGVTQMNWLRFSAWGAAGEVVWVSVYVYLGCVFGDNFAVISEIMSNASGIMATGVITLFLGWRLIITLRTHKANPQV